MSLLHVENLAVRFPGHGNQPAARAVDGVSFRMEPGKTHALVGESGCGKSVTSLAIAGLLPADRAIIQADRLDFKGRALLTLTPAEYRDIRGRDITMIFQEPMTALNPVMRVGRQVVEAIDVHEEKSTRTSADARRKAVVDLFAATGLQEPDIVFEKYPHQLSGGMRQRVMIAMALALRPSLLIADEPTTALDVTVQAQILELMNNLQRDIGMAVLLITHDLGVVAKAAHTVSILYAGQVVESGSVRDVFARPCHPYTEALFQSLPARQENGNLRPIPGSVPPATEYDRLTNACRFYDRCQYQDDRCFRKPAEAGHTSFCARSIVGHEVQAAR
jgi:peptide/nickel transport system ATP-binding protein